MLSCAVRPGNPGRRQPIPGNEPPQVSARAAGGGFDGEAGGPDRPLRVAVRPAATRDPGPCRLDQVLQSSAPRALGPDVLEHPERPPGLSVRRTSRRPASGSSTLQKTRPLTTVSKAALRNGSASARAWTSRAAGARRRARRSGPDAGSTPTAPVGRNGRFRPVPQPRSRTRPRAPSQSHRRQLLRPVHSATARIAS